jgi:hypothetical protein
MNTQKITAEQIETTTLPTVRTRWFAKQAEALETNRFGWMALMIMVQSCIGSIACMYILRNDAGDLMLAACAAVTMGSNATLIAQANAKLCLAVFYLSIVVNTILIAVNV